MRLHYTPIAFGVLTMLAGASGAIAAPTVAIKAPVNGSTLKSGLIQGSPDCYVTGSNIAKVIFFVDGVQTNYDMNGSNGWGCYFDSTKLKDGSHSLKAVAYDAAGATATTTGTFSTKLPVSTAPTVQIAAPTSGATIKSGTIAGAPDCYVTGSNIAKVVFFVDGVQTNYDMNGSNGWGCYFDSTKLATGSHSLKAVAYNAAGQSVTTTGSFSVQNGSTTPPPPSTGAIDAADIIQSVRADTPFSSQVNWWGQAVNTYPYVTSIPETGIQYTQLSNGDTLRLGKVADPMNSVKRVMHFEVAPTDPLTSNNHRVEITTKPSVGYEKVYWVALSVFVHDWGTLSTSDVALFGTQLHPGYPGDVSPSIQLDTVGDGRSFIVAARYSTSLTPNQSNSVSVKSTPMAIPFGRWMDVVIKFKQNITGAGFMQAYVDGNLVFDYKGNLGFKSDGTYTDYFKFGYYNWTSAMNSSRKILLRNPVVVADPTGSKYSPATLRSYINQ